MVASSESVGSLVRHDKRSLSNRLFDSSRLHGLESSASDFRNEHEFYIDVFFKHRSYSGNHKHDGASLIQAWNAFIDSVGEIGHDAWFEKLTLSRNRFEKRTSSSARYRHHRSSREAGLPCPPGVMRANVV